MQVALAHKAMCALISQDAIKEEQKKTAAYQSKLEGFYKDQVRGLRAKMLAGTCTYA